MTQTVVTHIALTPTGTCALTADGSKAGTLFPAGYLELAGMVTWSINIRGLQGNPDVARIEARFVDVLEHTFDVQFVNPARVPFTALQTKAFVREGVGWSKNGAANPPASAGEWGVIYEKSDNAGPSIDPPITITRTVEAFSTRHQVELRVTLTGGGLTDGQGNITGPAQILAGILITERY